MLKITYGNAISICINDGISTVQCTIHAPCYEYAFMINTNILEPISMTVMMVASQKRWPVMRGKVNMICKEWKWTEFHKFSETFLAFPEGFHCTCSINL